MITMNVPKLSLKINLKKSKISELWEIPEKTELEFSQNESK